MTTSARPAITGRTTPGRRSILASLSLSGVLVLTGCDIGTDGITPTTPTTDDGTTTAADDTATGSIIATDDAAVSTEPVAAPLIPEDVVARLDAAMAAETTPVATTTAQTEDGLPTGATLDILQLEGTRSGGYLLRVRLSYDEDMRLSPAQQRSLSLDGEATFVDGIRLLDPAAERFALPTVFAPQEEEQIDNAERYRCLCSDLVSTIPTTGQILSALYGPLGDDVAPTTLTIEVPGFKPLEDVPVG